MYRSEDQRTIATVGFRYEAASGNRDVFQGRGDGMLNPFVSALWGTDRLHLMGYVAPRIAIDGGDSSFFDLSAHADYRFENFYPLIELNWIHVLDGGRRLPIDQEGFDFFNFGSTEAGGNDVVTLALGGRLRALDSIQLIDGRLGVLDLGTAFEFPVTNRKDLFDWRITTDLIFRIEPGALFAF